VRTKNCVQFWDCGASERCRLWLLLYNESV